jgi:hypothetical protein
MAIACPVDLDVQMLRSEVSKIYARVAADPNGDFHSPRSEKPVVTLAIAR